MWTYVYIPSGKIGTKWLNHMKIVCLNFEETAKLFFQSGCAIFHFKKQYIRIPAASPPCQDMTSSEFQEVWF